MANLTSVGVTSGVPTSGTGTVSTIDNLLAVGVPISDGTTNLVAVKAASTAPIATDKALVVALSPNSVNANGQTTMANSAPVAIASDQTGIPAKIVGNAGAIMDFVGQNATAPANSLLVGAEFNTSPTTLTTGKASPLQMDSAGNLLVNLKTTPTVNLVPTTSGGLTITSTLIASGTNATSVKASTGQLYKIEVTNNSANIGYLKIYNTASAPTAGSGTPVIRLMCPASTSGAGAFSSNDSGIAFSTGIGFTFTGGIADADTTSVAASAFIVNLYYK